MNFFKRGISITLPAKGELLELSQVPDEAFSQKMLGDGFAVDPENGTICSPVDGILQYIFPTGHAFGVESDDFEVLVHIGIDTVELEGNGFTILKKEGETVRAGEPVIEADLEKIRAAGKSVITPVILTPKGKKSDIRINKEKQTVDVY